MPPRSECSGSPAAAKARGGAYNSNIITVLYDRRVLVLSSLPPGMPVRVGEITGKVLVLLLLLLH